jgi:tetratricopeptide (TPR) repeat protein
VPGLRVAKLTGYRLETIKGRTRLEGIGSGSGKPKLAGKDSLNTRWRCQESVKLDPNFALAYAGIAHVWGGMHEFRSQDPEYVEKGLEASAKAERLAPDLADVLSARAHILYAQHRYDDAIHLALRAVAEQPECEGAQDVLGRAYFASGRYEEAARLAESAMEIVSNDYNALIPLINSLERLGRIADAERLRRREVEVLQDQLQHFPDDVRARVLLAADLANFGDADGAACR